MNAFDKAMQHVLQFEGGYGADPLDPGNWTGPDCSGDLKGTKYGISARSFPLLDIKNLTEEQARSIYSDRYWREIQGDKLPEPLAIMLMDSAVNCGISRSVKWLQKALRVQQDGNLGPVTLSAVRTQTGVYLAQEVGNARERHYRLLKTWPRFGKGWMRRLDACRRLCGLNTGA